VALAIEAEAPTMMGMVREMTLWIHPVIGLVRIGIAMPPSCGNSIRSGAKVDAWIHNLAISMPTCKPQSAACSCESLQEIVCYAAMQRIRFFYSLYRYEDS